MKSLERLILVSGNLALDANAAIRMLESDDIVLETIPSEDVLNLPMVVMAEMYYGAINSRQTAYNLSRYEAFFQTCHPQPITPKTARIYAQLRLDLKKVGHPIPSNDLWIAAQCVEHNWTLFTFDRHFGTVKGLKVILVPSSNP